jgi:hypothetical protein
MSVANKLPTNADTARARFPATYEQARTALASCDNVDECLDWANKAEALAAYAKMADDDTLRTLADRIQARAIRRMGELLKEFDGKGNNQHGVGAHTTPSERLPKAPASQSTNRYKPYASLTFPSPTSRQQSNPTGLRLSRDSQH